MTLDLVRLVCALTVMLYHYLPLTALDGGRAWRGLWFGWLGVPLFFILSGQLIARSAVGQRPGAFLWRRWLRLAPAAWLCASLSALALLATGTLSAGAVAARWLAALAFVPQRLQVDQVYWTLSIEVIFYLLVALVLAGGASAARVERLGWVLGGASAAFWIGVMLTGASPARFTVDRPWQWTQLPYGCFFALGIALWAVRARGATWPRRAAIGAWSLTGLVELAAEVAYCRAESGEALGVALPFALFAGGVAVIAAAPRLDPLVRRWVSPARWAVIGRLTYPLYLVHRVVGVTVILFLVQAGVPVAVAIAAVTIAMPVLAWFVAERGEPALRRAMIDAAEACRRVSRFRDLAPDSVRSASPPAG